MCTPQQILGLSDQRERREHNMGRTWERREMHVRFCWGNLYEKDHLKWLLAR
jgi:hypothetical protein